MPKKKTNEIVEEQRRARRNFLELKRMQIGEMPTGPKPSEEAVKPASFAEKLKNIWYHDKYVILGGLAVCIVLIILVAQCCTRVQPDLQIVVFAYSPVSDVSCEKIADFAEQYCDDINGDGIVNVQLINCSFGENSDSQYRYTSFQKLQSTIAANNEALIYIVDEKGEAYFKENEAVFAECFEDDFRSVGESVYEVCEPDSSNILDTALPDGLRAACRKTSAQAFKKSKNLEDYVASSRAILEHLTE